MLIKLLWKFYLTTYVVKRLKFPLRSHPKLSCYTLENIEHIPFGIRARLPITQRSQGMEVPV
jgi:hypothetical protein